MNLAEARDRLLTRMTALCPEHSRVVVSHEPGIVTVVVTYSWPQGNSEHCPPDRCEADLSFGTQITQRELDKDQPQNHWWIINDKIYDMKEGARRIGWCFKTASWEQRQP